MTELTGGAEEDWSAGEEAAGAEREERSIAKVREARGTFGAFGEERAGESTGAWSSKLPCVMRFSRLCLGPS